MPQALFQLQLIGVLPRGGSVLTVNVGTRNASAILFSIGSTEVSSLTSLNYLHHQVAPERWHRSQQWPEWTV